MNARNSAPDGDAVGGVVRGVFVTTHMLTFFVVLLLLLLYWRGSGAPVAPEKKTGLSVEIALVSTTAAAQQNSHNINSATAVVVVMAISWPSSLGDGGPELTLCVNASGAHRDGLH